MFPSFTDVGYFLEISRTGSISRAAERLGITQPSLSLAVRRLEETLGTPLLIRSRSGVQLTRSGHELLLRGQTLVSQWELLKANVSKKAQELSGQYIIGCHSAVALYSLPSFLPELIQRYPQLEVRLLHNLSRKITEGVISFKIDLGIVVNPVQHPDLVIKELGKDVVSFWTAQVPSPTQVLGSEKEVLICDPSLQQVKSLLKSMQKKYTYARIIRSNSLEVITALTAAGAGIGIIPGRVVAGVGGHRLKRLDKSLPTYNDRICLVYRVDYRKNKGNKIMTDAISNAFANHA